MYLVASVRQRKVKSLSVHSVCVSSNRVDEVDWLLITTNVITIYMLLDWFTDADLSAS